jgi:glycosyltransferase involved in cell wall biosynthesis
MNLKKVILINSTFGVGGGAEVIASNIASKLLEKNVDVKFLVRKKAKAKNEFVQEMIKEGSLGRKISNLLSKFTGLTDVFFLWPFFLPFRRQFVKTDIINLHNLHSNYFSLLSLPLLSRWTNIVWTLHDAWAVHGKSPFFLDDDFEKNVNRDDLAKLDEYPFMERDAKKLLRWIKKFVYRFSKLTMVCPSNALKKYVESSKMFPKSSTILTINNGIKVQRFGNLSQQEARGQLSLPKDKKIIYFQAGWLSDKRKGIVDALKSIKFLKKKKSVFLLFTGYKGDEIESLIPNDMDYKIESYVDNDEIPKYFSAADIYAFPSRFENFSTTLLEAGASKLPSVCFDVGGNSEIIVDKKTGYIVDRKDFQNFWGKINTLLENDVQLKSLGQAARKRITEEFTLDQCVKQYISLFNSLNKK